MSTKLRSFKHIAELVKRKRSQHSKAYSQSELSHLLGYKNGQFISNVERGICAIPLKSLHKLMKTLDITKHELVLAMSKDFEETVERYLDAGEEEADQAEEVAPLRPSEESGDHAPA